MAVGCYPGTFDPPTVAHLAIAEAALEQGGLDALHLVVSRSPLAKDPAVPSFEDRISVLEQVAASRPWLEVRVTERRLIAAVAEGYDAVVMGTDKWAQVVDPAWYGGSLAERDRAVASLPALLLVPRPGSDEPGPLPPGAVVLEVHPGHGQVSSTLVRAGRVEWMAPEAARFDSITGAWSDPERYLRLRRPRQGASPGQAGPASLPPMPGTDRPRG